MSSDRILEWQRQAAAEGAPGLHPSPSSDFAFSDGDATTLESLRRDQVEFARERDWDKFHTPRNVLMAMVGEVGELSEIFQWRGDEGCAPGLPQWSDEDKTHLGEEMADVLLYLVRLADRCKVDLPAAAKRKLERSGAAVQYFAFNLFGTPPEGGKGEGKRVRRSSLFFPYGVHTQTFSFISHYLRLFGR